LISEFRFHGNSQTDDFVEIYNASDSVADISGYAIISSDNPTVPKYVAPGAVGSGTTRIPARSHFLITGAGYTLNGYAAGDDNFNADIPDNAGVGLYLNSNVSPATKIDAVGFKPVGVPFIEGIGLDPIGGVSNNGEISFVRNFGAQGYPVDTDNNLADFSFVSTDAGIYNGFQTILGAPGPENRNSPIFKPTNISTAILDSGSGITAAPNRVVNSANTGTAPLGTIASRRTYTNNTGFPITRFRIRIIGVSTIGSPRIYNPQSVVKALSSADINIQKADGSVVQVRGLTIESPTLMTGGGLNSSLIVTLNQPINPGESINVDTVIGVFANGRLIFNTAVETNIAQ
jgi:Lamin Tail Domain